VTQHTAPSIDHLVVAAAQRVRIRRRVRDDAADEFRWRSDPELAKFDAAGAGPGTFDDFVAAVEYDLAFGRAGREAFALETPDGCHIGSVMYYNADPECAEIGISIALDEYRGRGIGREAVAAFLRFLWTERPFRRVYLHTLEWNERAQRCFRAVGFEDRARVLRDGEWFLQMDVRREWWLLWDAEGRFAASA
jgi:RimJ/RimL family protein N-acetyltransferase